MFIILFSLLVGIVIGSFLNVCIYRIAKGESIVFPGSHCVNCGHSLNYLDLIPIISFLALKGRCRYCNQRFSIRYMLIELLTGIVFVGVYLKYGFSWESLLYCCFCAVLIVLSFVDFKEMLLPTSIITFGTVAGLIFRVIQVVISKDLVYLKQSLISALLGYGLFLSIFYLSIVLFKKEGLGFGDVRLMGMLGIYLPVDRLVLTVFLASLLASIYGLIVFYKKKASEPFPFGPFLNGAAMIAVFYGDTILTWYLRYAGF